jgi:hypothetical protein
MPEGSGFQFHQFVGDCKQRQLKPG